MHLNFEDNIKTNCPERRTSLFSQVLADDEALGFAIGSDKYAEISGLFNLKKKSVIIVILENLVLKDVVTCILRQVSVFLVGDD